MKKEQRYRWGERVVLLVSILLCLLLFVQDRSLLLDSLNVARNIGERSFAQLIDPLSYEQSAPLLFLWLSKLSTLILGVSHYSLRFLPFLAGIVSLFLFADISRKVLRSPFDLIALFWFGTHQLVARYATEYKQYMVDVFAALLIVWIAVNINEINRKNWWAFALGGGMLVWLSMPAVFVLISAIVYLGIVEIQKRKSIIPLMSIAAVVGISFLANYMIMLRPTIGSTHMQNFHNDFFLNGNIFNRSAISHDFGLIIEQARMLVGKSGLAIGTVLISVGISVYILIRQKRFELILLLFPIIGAYGASLLGKYSILERLMLFSLPLTILLVMVGMEFLFQKASEKRAFISKGLMFVLTIGLIVGFVEKQSFKYLVEPFEHEDNRSSLLYISNQEEENNRDIICTQHAMPAYDYYTKYDQIYRDMEVGDGIATEYNSDIKSIVLEKLKSQEKVWILANHYHEGDIDRLIRELEQETIIEKSHRAKSSAAIFVSIKGLPNKD